MGKQLTRNFNSKEFDCKDGTPVPEKYMDNLQKLANNLQILRNELGVPVMVTGSGYRTQSHNKAVGGAKNSQHLTASAADINAQGLTPKQLYDKIESLIASKKIIQGGLGLYKGFVHYDIRGTKARW